MLLLMMVCFFFEVWAKPEPMPCFTAFAYFSILFVFLTTIRAIYNDPRFKPIWVIKIPNPCSWTDSGARLGSAASEAAARTLEPSLREVMIARILTTAPNFDFPLITPTLSLEVSTSRSAAAVVTAAHGRRRIWETARHGFHYRHSKIKILERTRGMFLRHIQI